MLSYLLFMCDIPSVCVGHPGDHALSPFSQVLPVVGEWFLLQDHSREFSCQVLFCDQVGLLSSIDANEVPLEFLVVLEPLDEVVDMVVLAPSLVFSNGPVIIADEVAEDLKGLIPSRDHVAIGRAPAEFAESVMQVDHFQDILRCAHPFPFSVEGGL